MDKPNGSPFRKVSPHGGTTNQDYGPRGETNFRGGTKTSVPYGSHTVNHSAGNSPKNPVAYGDRGINNIRASAMYEQPHYNPWPKTGRPQTSDQQRRPYAGALKIQREEMNRTDAAFAKSRGLPHNASKSGTNDAPFVNRDRSNKRHPGVPAAPSIYTQTRGQQRGAPKTGRLESGWGGSRGAPTRRPNMYRRNETGK